MRHIQIIKDAFAIYGKQYRSLGDYSATSLISPPRQVALSKRYGHLVEPTVDSQVASLVGTAVHEKMENLLHLANVKNPDYLLEKSVAHPFTIDGKMRLVAGRFDILHEEKHLFDIKTAKTWKLVFDPKMVDWHEQQNIYAYLLHCRGVDIESLNILAFYLDWIESSAIRDKSYPQSPIVQYELEKWSNTQTKEFIEHRLKLHLSAEDTADDDLPECTIEERWEREPSYAIMKNRNAKRATRVVKDGTFSDALEVARGCKGLGVESYIEVRHSTRKRCEKYCSINGYCSHYQDYAAMKANVGLNSIFSLAEVL